MTLNLVDFPEELLISILSVLDATSLTRCAMTCRRIHKILKSSSLLQYIIHLYYNGITDSGTPPTQSTYSELVENLQRRRQMRMTPEWKMNLNLGLPDCDLKYDFSGDTFVRCSGTELEVTTLCTNFSSKDVEASTVNTKLIRFRAFSLREPTFGIDPTQDLIAVIENDGVALPPNAFRIICIHLHTLSSGATHPLAHHPLADYSWLSFSVPPNSESNTIHSAKLQIAHEVLMIQFYTKGRFWQGERQLRAIIWDWKTSTLLLDVSSSPLAIIPSANSGIGLLDSTHFFVASTVNDGSIRLYKLVRSAPSESPPVPVHLASLHFPPVCSDVVIDMIYPQAGPIESHSPPSSAPFVVNDDDRIHVFTTDYMYSSEEGTWGAMPTNLYVHQRVFMNYCTHGGESALEIPWYRWGPANTKIVFPSCSQAHWTRYVHGQRVLCPGPSSYDGAYYGAIRPDEVDSLSILDFSLASVLSAKGILPLPPSQGTMRSDRKAGKLVSPQKIRSRQIHLYEDDVETRLPCVSFDVLTQEGQQYHSYMIYADGVIGATNDDDTDELVLDAYTI